MVGHWHGGLGLGRRDGLRAVRRGLGLDRRRPSSRSARSSCRRWSSRAIPKRFGAGVITTSGALGILIPPSIVMVIYRRDRRCVDRERHLGLGRQLFMAGVMPGPDAGDAARPDDLVPRLEERLSAHAAGDLGASAGARSASRIWGLLLIVIVHRRHLHRHLHADRGGRDERGLRLRHRGVRLQDLTLRDVPKVLLGSANMSAMLLYIITNAVLFSFLMTHEQIPQAMAELDRRARASAGSSSCCWSTSCCCWPATSWSRPRSC